MILVTTSRAVLGEPSWTYRDFEDNELGALLDCDPDSRGMRADGGTVQGSAPALTVASVFTAFKVLAANHSVF